VGATHLRRVVGGGLGESQGIVKFRVAVDLVGWQWGFLTDADLLERAAPLEKSGYGSYLRRLVERR